jgi:hypothetical protein
MDKGKTHKQLILSVLIILISTLNRCFYQRKGRYALLPQEFRESKPKSKNNVFTNHKDSDIKVTNLLFFFN